MFKEAGKLLRTCVLCGILTCTGCSSSDESQIKVDLECGNLGSNTFELTTPSPETKISVGASVFSLDEGRLVINRPNLPPNTVASRSIRGNVDGEVDYKVDVEGSDILKLETTCLDPNDYVVAAAGLYNCTDQESLIGKLTISGLTESQRIITPGSNGIRYSPEQQGFVVEDDNVSVLLQRVEMPDASQVRNHGENGQLLEEDEPIAAASYEYYGVEHQFSTIDGATVIYTAECLTETTEDPTPTNLPSPEPTATACVRQYSDDHPTEAPCVNTPSN